METLWRALIVGSGGFVGSALRFTTAAWVQRLLPHSALPIGTLAVNVVGCLLIGGIAGVADHRWQLSQSTWLFLVVGVLGGFTTFSAFSHEVFMLGAGGHRLHAMIHVMTHLVLGVGAAWLGYGIATRLP
jgi:CrcB protein